ncbi:MAG: DUF4296 domain-containing protein [Flavobacteriaceae bacterium]|nr:DUF4296 domain-containing protein [Flavobacteriaceae bacterium]
MSVKNPTYRRITKLFKSSILLLTMLCVFQCKKIEKPPIPDPLLSKEQMTQLMVDISLYRSAQALGAISPDDGNQNNIEAIYPKYGIDSTSFSQNFAYYTADNKSFVQIMETAKSRLEAMQEDLKAQVARDTIEQEKFNETQTVTPVLLDSAKVQLKQKIQQIKEPN